MTGQENDLSVFKTFFLSLEPFPFVLFLIGENWEQFEALWNFLTLTENCDFLATNWKSLLLSVKASRMFSCPMKIIMIRIKDTFCPYDEHNHSIFLVYDMYNQIKKSFVQRVNKNLNLKADWLKSMYKRHDSKLTSNRVNLW